MNRAELARVAGLIAPGASEPGSVSLADGDVYRVGRADRRWLKRTGHAGAHLALPAAPATVPVVAVLLVVRRTSIDIRLGERFASVEVDGAPLGRAPVRLAGPAHQVTIDPHGNPRGFRLTFQVRPPDPAAVPPSGTTLVPQLHFQGERLRSLAVALAWPLVAEAPAPLTPGWSTAAVEARYSDLYGAPPGYPARRTLHDLRLKLVDSTAPDGRPMAAIPELRPWPWEPDRRAAGFLTEDAFIEHANMITAGHLANNDWVRDRLDHALDRRR